jgi:hypothetical protein
VCAAAPVETMTLKDGRKVNVYATTADATTAVADAFVSAYHEARAAATPAATPARPCVQRGACGAASPARAPRCVSRRARSYRPLTRRHGRAGCAQEGVDHHRHSVR